jgi:hypothetical protein
MSEPESIAVVAIILGIYLLGLVLWMAKAHNDRLNREYFRNRAELEALAQKYQCNLTAEEADELMSSRWDGD